MTNLSSDPAFTGRPRLPYSGLPSGLFRDSDTALILALILLLYSDNGDRLLLLALLYIIS